MAFFVSEGIQSSEIGCSERVDVESGPQVHEQDCEPARCSNTVWTPFEHRCEPPTSCPWSLFHTVLGWPREITIFVSQKLSTWAISYGSANKPGLS